MMELIGLRGSELLIHPLLLFSAIFILFSMLCYVTSTIEGMLEVWVDYLFRFWIPNFDLIRLCNCSSFPIAPNPSSLLAIFVLE